MRLVKPSFEIWSNDMPLLEKIEKAGRVAYQSNEEGDPEKFVRKIIKKGHESVLEHGWIGLKDCWIPAIVPISEIHGFWEQKDVLWGNIRFWRKHLSYFANRGGLYEVVDDLRQAAPVLFEDFPQVKNGRYTRVLLLDNPPIATVNFIVDRGVSHELVRHRIASFTQESTRYCCYKDHVTFVIPPWEKREPGEYNPSHTYIGSPWFFHMLASERIYHLLIGEGVAPGPEKWTAQQARSVLPNSLKTQIVATATWDEWQLIFALRTYPDAHPQMQEVMIPLKQEFQKQFPLEWFSDEAIDNRRNELLNRSKS